MASSSKELIGEFQLPDCTRDDESAQVSSRRSQCVSLADRESNNFHGPVTHNMKLLLNEFKGLYEEKLRRLEVESRDENNEEVLRMKVRILHSYVNDLSDQNQVLVQTVEDLEKEADEKVSYLDVKLLRAKQTLNNYKTIISEKEKVATGLAKTKESLQHEISVLSSKWECTEKAAECLRSENLDMKIDIATLIGAMQQGRIMQKLDFSSLTLRTVPFEYVVGPTDCHSQIPKPEAILNKHVDNLKSQLDARDRAIQGLKDELEKALYERDKSMDEASERNDALSMLQSKLQALQKSELAKVGQIADKDIIITKLRTELQFAQQDGNAIQNELSFQQKKVSELLKAIGKLKEEMAEKDADNTVFFKSSKILEKKSVMLTTELQKRGDELQRQQKEILSLQQKKDGLFAEFQTQEHRIFQLQESLQSRDVEAEHWKAQIAQLQSELEATRNLYKQATRQLEDLKLTAQQQGQSSKDNQNVLTAEAAHWHDAFVALKSDFIELEKKHLQALAQISYKEEATKKLNAEFMKTTAKLDDTKHELEGVQAELVKASCDRDAVQIEVQTKVAMVTKSLTEECTRKIQEQQLKLRQINEDLTGCKERYTSAKEEISALDQAIVDKNEELQQLQLKYQESLEDNGRLQTRLEALTVTAQSEQEVHNNEICCTEDIIHKLRMQQFEYDEKMILAEGKIHQQEQMLVELQKKYLVAVDDVEKKNQLICYLEKQLEQTQLSDKEAVLEVNERGETIRHLQLDMNSLKATQDSLKRTVALKEHLNNELYQQCDNMKQMLEEMQYKLKNSEEQVNTLGLEVGLLKSRLQEKTEKSQQLEDQILKQQEALSRASETLKDTRKAAGNKIHKKENKLGILQKELLEAQNQYTACYNELLHRENLMQKLKDETVQLTDQIKAQSQDINKLNSEKKKLEMELAVVMEKHRTAQQEVNNRDQIILQLKTNLKTMEEKYLGSQEELGLHETEVTRLNQKLKCLQSEVRELWYKCSEQEDRMNQAEKENQQLQHENNIYAEQIQNHIKTIEQLNSDLDVTKQSHTTDLERWNQKTSLLQKQLDLANEEQQEAHSKVHEYKTSVAKLKEQLDKTEQLFEEAIEKAEQYEESLKKQNLEIAHLRQYVEDLQKKVDASNNLTKACESTADLFKQKYQTCMEKVQELEAHIQSLEEEIQNYNNQIHGVNETVHNLKAEILSLQHRYDEKCNQMENSEEAIDQLTEELQTAQENVKNSNDRVCDCERLIQELKDEVEHLHKEISDEEDTILRLQSDLTLYQSSHGHSNEEFEAQRSHIEHLQKELDSVRKQCHEKTEECERTMPQLKAESVRATELQKKYALEIEKLERTLQSLHLDVAASHQDHKLAIVRLEQEIEQLESDLAEASNACSQKDQAIRKRDDLLKKSESDLLQAGESIKGKVSEIEHLNSVVKNFKANIQGIQKDKRQKEQENMTLKTEIQQLNQELQEVHKQYREAAQELAILDEKFLLMESSLKATQEQLTERVAETVRHEQMSRKLQTELKTMKERVSTAEEEVTEYKQMVETLKTDLNTIKNNHQQALQETMKYQQMSHKMEVENTSARDQARTLKQQLQQQEELVRCLREELDQEQNRYQDQQRQLNRLKLHFTEMETEVEQLRIKQKNDTHTVNHYEETLAKQRAELKEAIESYKMCNRNLMAAEQNIHELKLEISLIKGSHKEDEDKLNDNIKLVAILNTNLTNTQQENEKLKEDIFANEMKMKHLNSEVKKVNELHKQTEVEVQNNDEQTSALTKQLYQMQRMCQENIKDLANKEEQLVILKTEVVSLQEKFRCKVEEAENLRNGQLILKQKWDASKTELETVHQALEASRMDNSRLRQESELVVANVNRWIKEQKIASDNLGAKIKEQNKLLAIVSAEKDHLQETKEALESELKNLKAEMEENKVEKERLKTQQNNSVNQQVLLNQLRDRLELQEHEQESLMAQKLSTIEEMHSRLKANIESIQQLNQQLNTLSKENLHQRKLLEKEQAKRKQLELQLKTCNQISFSPRAPLETRQEQKHHLSQLEPPHQEARSSDPDAISHLYHVLEKEPFRTSDRERTETLTRRDLEEPWIRDSLDKSYWIQRVGELSAQLQESTEYWSEKMNELTMEIEQAHAGSPKK
ncbi:early endosome antigen 1-like [Huso huso]|uniref:Early endosome antigen 1-like n=1 Tax=Huso huso TaxID=61971 RepID=A0ABR1A1R8_HUSHU